MVKSKKFGLADKVQNKKKAESKKINPFEVHINKVKSKVLGRNIKDERGLPGISRAKAVQKRKDTIAKELKVINKTNTIVDLRNRNKGNDNMQMYIGKKSKNIFNLADEEITHRGDTIDHLEKFVEPPLSDDEDGEGQFGGLDDKFVSEGHFAGGIVGEAKDGEGLKSRKDLIEQLIAESKKRKADKQKEKEENMDLTDKLDTEWKDLQPVVFKRARQETESAIDKLLNRAEKNNQDYDKMMRELKFEKRGTPSDALKSDEQQKKEESEKLKKLEEERNRRMFDEEDLQYEQQPTIKHRSADALDDNFDLEDNPDFMLAYDKDGKPLVPDHILQDYSVPNMQSDHKSVSDDETNENDDSDGDESEEGSDDENEDNSDGENEENSNDEGEENKDNSDDENDKNAKQNSEEIASTHLESKRNAKAIDDSKNDSSSEENDTDDDDSNDFKVKEKDKLDDLNDLRESDPESEEEIETEINNKKISCFFNVPNEEGENLKALLQEKSPEQQSIALGKLIKSYDPGLNETNKDKLSRLFAHMLQHLNDSFTDLQTESDIVLAFKIYNKIGPHFYDLVQKMKVSTKTFYGELLMEKHEIFIKNRRRKMPDLDTLIFFKLVTILYPTSDHRHPIATPCVVFMSEILRKCSYNDIFSISRGLFIAAILAEYTNLSKRYVPEVINFLRGIIYLAANTSTVNPIQLVPPFRLRKEGKILKLEQDCSELELPETRMTSRELCLTTVDNEFRVRSLVTCVKLLREFFDYFHDLEAQICIFEPHLQLLGRIDVELYPKQAANVILDTIKYMKECFEVKVFKPLTSEKKKPKLLRMYEPEFQDVFTGTKSSKSERDKLKHKYKREMRGALREVKRDAAFIAGYKIEKRIKSDQIRKEKVKQIYKEAGIQQAELNKLKRKQ